MDAMPSPACSAPSPASLRALTSAVRRPRPRLSRPNRSRRVHEGRSSRAATTTGRSCSSTSSTSARRSTLHGPGGVCGCGASSATTRGSSATATSSGARSSSTASTIGEADRRKYEDDYPAPRAARASSAQATNAPAQRPRGARRPRRRRRRRRSRRRVDGLIRQTPPAAVRLVGVLPALQVRGRPVRARRPRAVRRPRRPAHRVLPDEALLNNDGTARAARTGAEEPRQERPAGRRAAAADEQGRARHALGRADVASDRQIHVRQRGLRFPARRRGSCTSTPSKRR